MTKPMSVTEADHRRSRAEDALLRSEERYRTLFDAVPVGLYRTATDGRIANANPAMAQMLGFSTVEALIGRPAVELYARPEVRQEWTRRLETEGLVRGFEAELRRQDGSTLWALESARAALDAAGRILHIEGTVQDITERKQAEQRLRDSEAQLRQSQKMEAVGQLAGGVAHDFNNLLGVIIGYSDLLLRDAPEGSLAARRLNGIREAGDRAAALTRELLAFGRRQVLQPRVLDLNALITDAQPMLARVVKERVQIVTVLDPGLGSVRADPGQLRQVILNFAVNARDAMPDGGTLTLETRNVEPHGGSAPAPRPGLPPGRYVALLVSDTGHGMAPEVLEHMFEPFFTTRPQGLGTGLGLSTVYGVVTQSGGHLEVESAVGRGTTFTVYLPRDAAERERPAPPPLAPERRARDTVLLVEDAAPLREMVQEILEGEGFAVIAAESGELALAAAAAHEGKIALVITDVVMPGMSGPEAAERLQARRPGTRVLLMSGYTDAAIGQEGALDPRTHFIQKPFSADALLQKVREVLASPADQGTGA